MNWKESIKAMEGKTVKEIKYDGIRKDSFGSEMRDEIFYIYFIEFADGTEMRLSGECGSTDVYAELKEFEGVKYKNCSGPGELVRFGPVEDKP